MTKTNNVGYTVEHIAEEKFPNNTIHQIPNWNQARMRDLSYKTSGRMRLY